MIKNKPEQLATQIMDFYNQYDLKVSGKINNQTAYELIKTIEETYQTDTIQLSDGTRIWNLLRIFLYSHFQKSDDRTIKKKLSKNNIKSILSVFKEGFVPLKLPKDTTICGFSSSESRKLYHDTYYDIYLDPLYDILGDKLAVFEWPETTGYRRKYNHPVFSRHYVPMHFPLWSNTFWDLLTNKLTGRRNFTLESEVVLNEIIEFISTTASVDKTKLTEDIYDFITVFVSIKCYLYSILRKIKPQAVIIRCGYGRFPMALSQTCLQLKIPSIEIQHGLITAYQPGYRKTTPTANKDCLPQYLLTHGEIFTNLVKDGNLFDKNKVVTTGFPFLERSINESKKNDIDLKISFSPYQRNILLTSQWIAAEEIKEFTVVVAELLTQANMDIGIFFKPHPYDKTDYTEFRHHSRIILINKYENIYKLFTIADIHTTVYSTSGLEAMAFGTPNIFIDIYHLTSSTDSIYIVSTPKQFLESIKYIFSNYQEATKEASEISSQFFRSSTEKNFKDFFSNKGLL